MTNAPPCATCGSALRWYPDHYGWGCDRCRQFNPAPRPAPAAVPAVRAATPPSAFQPIAQGRKRSTLPILIGVGGVAVLAIGIALILKVKGGKAGGAATRQQVLEDTFAALEAGDADRLIDLSDGGALFTKIMDCKGRDDDDDRPRRKGRDGDDDDGDIDDMRDPDKVAEKVVREARRGAAVNKGVKIEILDVLTREPPKLDDKRHADDDDDDDRPRRAKPVEPRKDRDRDRDRDRDDEDDRDRDRDGDLDVTLMRKGKKITKGCYAKQTFRMQMVKVRIRVQEDDREPDTQKVTLNVVEVDGRYYLGTMPNLKLHGSYGRTLEVIRDEMCECTDSKCARKIDREWKRYDKYLLRESKDRLKKDELAKLEPAEKELKECRKRAGGRGDAGDDAVAKMAEVTDRMCACKDKACSERVQEDFTKWGTEMAKKDTKDKDEGDPEVQKKITDIMTRYSECMMKLYSPDAGGAGLDPAPYGMPSLCSEYRDVTARLMGCTGVSPSRRMQLKEDWRLFSNRWRDSADRSATELSCRTQVDVLKEMQTTLCI